MPCTPEDEYDDEDTQDIDGGNIKPGVQLSGHDGNAFMIIGTCLRAAKWAGWPKEKIESVRKEMMMVGDYDHLLQVAMKHFDVE